MDIGKIKLLIETLKYIKWSQIYYQVYYRLKNKFFKFKENTLVPFGQRISFEYSVVPRNSYLGDFNFKFLNLDYSFSEIDWNFSGHGKLWTYNLNYFEFLLQENLDREEGFSLIKDFISQKDQLKDALEPYPISLRCINWVKFLANHETVDSELDAKLYNDLKRLSSNLEYHIMANHYLENGFGLLFGAYYFKDDYLYQKAKKIIQSQLKEQILKDGGHYELSPMYHLIILHRVLDSFQLVSKNPWKDDKLEAELQNAAELMLGWISQIQFKNGDFPMVNDSTIGVAPSPKELMEYAKRMEIVPKKQALGDSGYRKLETESLELLFDVGQIAPSYQPGHSHADNLQILAYKNGLPVLVETGISTYEKNERRQNERSTSSHNTVTVNRLNSSEVWSGFRVGRHAKTTILEDSPLKISAKHNGYRRLGLEHQRTIEKVEQSVVVKDAIEGKFHKRHVEGHLHFHPDRKVEISDLAVIVDNIPFIQFLSPTNLTLIDYEFCCGFNKTQKAQKIIYSFHQNCSFQILN